MVLLEVLDGLIKNTKEHRQLVFVDPVARTFGGFSGVGQDIIADQQGFLGRSDDKSPPIFYRPFALDQARRLAGIENPGRRRLLDAQAMQNLDLGQAGFFPQNMQMKVLRDS